MREELGKWGSEASVRDSPTGTRANTARSNRSSASRLSQGSAASVRPVGIRQAVVSVYRHLFCYVYGSFCHIWFILSQMVRFAINGSLCHIWFVLSYMVRFRFVIYGSFSHIWFVSSYMARFDIYGLFGHIWLVFPCMVHFALYSSFCHIWFVFLAYHRTTVFRASTTTPTCS